MSCPDEMPPSTPPCVIALEALRRHFVAMLGASVLDGFESGADLDALHRIDSHHGARQIGIEPLEHRLTPTAAARPWRMTVTRAPMESPASRIRQMKSSSSWTRDGSGQKKGFS